jgi:hypothetical protein
VEAPQRLAQLKVPRAPAAIPQRPEISPFSGDPRGLPSARAVRPGRADASGEPPKIASPGQIYLPHRRFPDPSSGPMRSNLVKLIAKGSDRMNFADAFSGRPWRALAIDMRGDRHAR